MPSYSSHGDRLHYDERGTGDPVVVLGGGPARHPDYLGDLGGLGDTATLLLPHLRGVGGSPAPEDPALGTWWNQAADVEALREHLGVQRLTVLGHSAGTRIALAFAARFPDSLARLVLVGPPAADLVEVEPDVLAIRARRAGEPAYEQALAIAQQGPPADGGDDALNEWQQRIAPLAYAAWGPAQQEHARIGAWTGAAIGAYGSMAAPASLAADLGAVDAPVRIIAGDEDGLVGRDAPLAIAALFRDGRSTSLPGTGHYPWVDRPEAFAAAARTALTE